VEDVAMSSVDGMRVRQVDMLPEESAGLKGRMAHNEETVDQDMRLVMAGEFVGRMPSTS
jgi:hypothetical protein